nr:MAG TPA: hypothetical protein [Caudoviricetes sp.]DAJ59796.1 MAG TPA: hypothetical protein [Caudoviricetes sp.]
MRVYFVNGDWTPLHLNSVEYMNFRKAANDGSTYYYGDGKMIFLDKITHIEM